MFKSVSTYLTRKKVQRNNSQRKKNYLSWDRISRIALVIEEGEKFSKNEMDQFVQSLKKYAEIFFVELKSKQASYDDWKCLVKKDRAFFGLPKPEVTSQIKSKSFDLLICVNRTGSFFISALASDFKAPYKCGNADLFGELDLIIERKPDQFLLSYLKDVQKYLEMIRTA
jgi:hypothetical protein